jgi:hypothetical protein
MSDIYTKSLEAIEEALRNTPTEELEERVLTLAVEGDSMKSNEEDWGDLGITPRWFNMPDSSLDEEELREKLEYETAQLEYLKMDIVNTEIRIANIKEKLDEQGV